MRSYFIDPGINGCGLACFDTLNQKLLEAHYVRPSSYSHGDTTAERVLRMATELMRYISPQAPVLIERPQIYTIGKGKGDPNDLICLAEIGACLMGMMGKPIAQVLPRQWKNTMDPDVLIGRIRERLTNEEFATITFPENTCDLCRNRLGSACVKSACPMHNCFDAIGIGMWKFGRLERKRIVCR